MVKKLFCTNCMFFVLWLTGCNKENPPDKEIPVLEKFTGECDAGNLPDIKFGMIGNELEWKKIWSIVSPNLKPPSIEFSKHFIFVKIFDSNNPHGNSLPSILVEMNKDGVISTMLPAVFSKFEPANKKRLVFYKIPREGVNGLKFYDANEKKLLVVQIPN